MRVLFFAGLALAIWVAPEDAARQVGVEAVRAAGTAMLRADLGGLFAGMAVLCGTAAWTRRQPWIVAAGTMLTAIVVGRFLDWIDAGRVGGDVIEMAIELGIIAALIVFARGANRAGASSTASSIPDVDQAGAERLASTINTAPLEDDALRVAVCGASAPLPSAPRAKACVAVSTPNLPYERPRPDGNRQQARAAAAWTPQLAASKLEVTRVLGNDHCASRRFTSELLDCLTQRGQHLLCQSLLARCRNS